MLTPDCPDCGTKMFLEKESEGGGFIFRIYCCACGGRHEGIEQLGRRLVPRPRLTSGSDGQLTPRPGQMTSPGKVISGQIQVIPGIGGRGGLVRAEVRSGQIEGLSLADQPQKLLTRARVGRGTSRPYDAEFERVWLGCEERRGHKKPAFDAWLKVKLPAEVICPVYAKWRQTDQWQRGFVPHLSTWLNRRGWETEPGPGEFKAPDDGRSAPVASIDVRRESFREQAALAARLARVRSDLGARARPAPLGAAASDVVRHLADSKEIA